MTRRLCNLSKKYLRLFNIAFAIYQLYRNKLENRKYMSICQRVTIAVTCNREYER